MTLQKNIKEYLFDRYISEEVIERFNIHQQPNDTRIALPIMQNGKPLFYKYRRNPNSDVGPKYTYTSGSTAALFNRDALKDATTVYITEGEFDALVLESYDMTAVSSTGGCLTFNPDWAQLFDGKEVFICYDNDTAGKKGMINVLRHIPHAQVILLPDNLEGKDITDFFKTTAQPAGAFKALPYFDHVLPENLNIDKIKTKVKLKNLLKSYNQVWSYYAEKIATADDTQSGLIEFYGLCQQALADDIKKIQSHLTYMGKGKANSEISDRIERAKSVPCEHYIVFDRGFAKCPWHNERTPSLKYNPSTNKMYCFGGCGPKDVIDLVMLKHDVDFKSAVAILLNEQQ